METCFYENERCHVIENKLHSHKKFIHENYMTEYGNNLITKHIF